MHLGISPPVLVLFGAAGQLGRAVQAMALPSGWTLRAFDRAQVDITDRKSIETALEGVETGLVLNAAAYTGVDKAESEPDLAYAINGTAPGLIAAAAEARGLAMAHISTDFVFDGQRDGAYTEDDQTHPVSVYGASKLAGEGAVFAANPRSVVLRTAWVFSPYAACFPRAIFRALRSKPVVTVVDDQRGCPTPASGIAQVVLAMAPALSAAATGDSRYGLFNLCGDGAVSRYQFALEIAAAAQARGVAVGTVTPCHTIPPGQPGAAPAQRPANSVLSCARLQAVHGIAAPTWRDTLPACIERYEEEP